MTRPTAQETSPDEPQIAESTNGSRSESVRPPAANVPTQAQIYDNLRRIGELEDKRSAIQHEIDSRTAKLRSTLPHVAQDSLLYRMLTTALGVASEPDATKTTGGAAIESKKANPARRSVKKASSRSKPSASSKAPKRTTKKATSVKANKKK